jgi:hypothetical protein
MDEGEIELDKLIHSCAEVWTAFNSTPKRGVGTETGDVEIMSHSPTE